MGACGAVLEYVHICTVHTHAYSTAKHNTVHTYIYLCSALRHSGEPRKCGLPALYEYNVLCTMQDGGGGGGGGEASGPRPAPRLGHEAIG